MWRRPRSRTLQTELNAILGWIEQLNEVDVDGVEPLTGGAQMALKMRDDVVTDGGYRGEDAGQRAGPRRATSTPCRKWWSDARPT